MTDAEFLDAFDTGGLGAFHHRDHLRLAWLRCRQAGTIEAAETRVGDDILAFARRAGAPRKYHETLTRFWVRAVAHADAVHAPASFDDLLEKHGSLLDQRLPLRHWSAEVLWSESARTTWVEPDVRALGFER